MFAKNPYYKLHISKDRFKFSAAHMTIFPDGSKEALHGHNYQVSLDIYLADHSFKNTLPFQKFKEGLTLLCGSLDEKILIAAKNPLTKIKKTENSIEIDVCNKNYRLPADEVELLEIDNITVEALAYYVTQFLKKDFLKLELDKISETQRQTLLAIRASVHESKGQGASYFCEF